MASLNNHNNNYQRKRVATNAGHSHSSQYQQSQKGKKKGPAPQNYVFNDISNYEDNQQILIQQKEEMKHQNICDQEVIPKYEEGYYDIREERNIIQQIERISTKGKDQQQLSIEGFNIIQSPDDTDFNSSCCDYQSDIFKEQPSEYIDDFSSNRFISGVGNNDQAPYPGSQQSNYRQQQHFQSLQMGSVNQIFSLQDCASESDFKENLLMSGNSVKTAYVDASNQRDRGIPQLPQQVQSQPSLRVTAKQNNENRREINSDRVASSASSQNQNIPTQSQASSNNHTTKNSCDQSLVTPSQKFNSNINGQSSNSTTSKHSKQPLYSMVPNQINKNLNRNVLTPDGTQPSVINNQQQKGRVYSYQESRGANFQNKRIEGVSPLSINESMDEAISQNQRKKGGYLKIGGDSCTNLTPQRNNPQPLSPQIKPSLSNMSRAIQENTSAHSDHSVGPQSKPPGKIMSLNYQMQSNMQQQAQINTAESRNISAPYSNKTQNSGQKATVVYNEFKYYTTGTDFQNTVNPQKYINISGLNQGNQLLSVGKCLSSSQNKRKSDISSNSISQPPVIMNGLGATNSLQYELSPNNPQQQCMFDMSSPKESISNGKQSFAHPSNTGTFVKANSIRKQIFNTDRNHVAPKFTHNNNASAAYQMHLKNEDYSPTKVILEAPFSLCAEDDEAQSKIRHLQQYIEQLESDLQDQQSKNADLKRRFKQRSFIQSFERANAGSGVNGNASSKKHLSDTEDSLILSEKKGKKNSIQGKSSNLNAPRGSSAMRQNTSITNGNGYTFQAPGAQLSQHLEEGRGMQHSNSNCAIFGPNQQANNSKEQLSAAANNQQHQQYSLQNTNSRTNSHDAHPHQKSSSILDVKIRPIVNMKGMQMQRNLAPTNLSPQKLMRNSSALQFKNQENQQDDSQGNLRRLTDQESSNILEYQVQDFHDQSSSQLNQSPLKNGLNLNQEGHVDEAQSNNSMQELGNTNQQVSEDDCEGCERLKQLVFQAKEAIDDLKLEIDEWRDICSDKETELRQLQHKIYCDIAGVEKKTEFKDEVQTKEFDSEKPSCYLNGANGLDAKKIRNFIQHNKNRIRSRSKTHGSALTSQAAGSHSQVRSQSTQDQGQFSSKKNSSNCCSSGVQSASANCYDAGSSFRKKSALKNMKDLVRDDQEFYEAQDQGVQTSFIKQGESINQESNQVYTNASEADLASAKDNQQNITSQRQDLRIKSQDKFADERSQAYLQQQQQQSQNMITAQYEEICSLRTQNQIQEQEISRMKQQMSIMTNQIEKFVSLIAKTRKRNSKKLPGIQVDIDEIKSSNDFISNIESYSILEKINEWRREEGLMDSQNEPVELQDPQPTRIPRPLKLIMDIDLNELDLIDPTFALQNAKKSGGVSSNGQVDNTQISGLSGALPPFNLNASSITQNYLSTNTNLHSSVGGNLYKHSQGASSSLAAQQLESNAQELLQMIKQEQENIKRVTDQKYKQFHRQQQEYLNNINCK